MTLSFCFLTGSSQFRNSFLTTGVSVLAQDPAVEAAGVDSQFVGHQEAKACRVQVGAAPDDAVLGEAAQFPGYISQNINCRRALLLEGEHCMSV